MVHLSITFPEELKKILDLEAKRERTGRSTLIQKAVRWYVEAKKNKKTRQLMIEGYQAAAIEDKRVSAEWDEALTDGLDG